MFSSEKIRGATSFLLVYETDTETQNAVDSETRSSGHSGAAQWLHGELNSRTFCRYAWLVGQNEGSSRSITPLRTGDHLPFFFVSFWQN